jgi:hypothetical protein
MGAMHTFNGARAAAALIVLTSPNITVAINQVTVEHINASINVKTYTT